MTEGLDYKIKAPIKKTEPDKWKKVLDKMIYAFGFFGPLMTIPQLLKIWVEKTAAGVSPISWAAYLLGAVFWFVYGIVHDQKPIIAIYAGWIIVNLFVLIGAIMYGTGLF